jgi:hypothetical protein
VIKDDLRISRTALESAACGFDPSTCGGQEAIDLVEEIGVQRARREDQAERARRQRAARSLRM